MPGLIWDSGRLTFIRGLHSIFLECRRVLELITVIWQKRVKNPSLRHHEIMIWSDKFIFAFMKLLGNWPT